MVARWGHPRAGIEAEDFKLDSGQPGDISRYLANIHQARACSNAELDHRDGSQTLSQGQFCCLEEAKSILLPHHQIAGNSHFITAEERDKDRKNVQVQWLRESFVKNPAQPSRDLVQQEV